MATTTPQVDVEELRVKVRDMYRRVAHEPQAEFHFEMGRQLAARLGYPPADLDRVPAEAIESFAGVGFFLDLAALRDGETVLDLGSGSGMDAFLAAHAVGAAGRVIGVDMTDEQLEKAEHLAHRDGYGNVSFLEGFLEALPVADETVDCVISNGVINLCADKERVFREIHRVLRPGGRIALADIVTDAELPPHITCNSTLWAACIGGAAQRGRYQQLIETAGLRVVAVRDNPEYRFLSRSAQGASRDYGVRSVSIRADRVA